MGDLQSSRQKSTKTWSHFAQVIKIFTSASAPLNVVGTFRSGGIMLWLALDEKLFCRMSPERERWIIIEFSPHEEAVPTGDEIQQVETELDFEHCSDTAAEEI
jgi:hypothetical protein